MTVAPLPHEAISASAGSGKTYQLAHRYIQLLANDVDPEHIIALTFSRKAAGEIFDSIVEYLCKAAQSGEQAAECSKVIGKRVTAQQYNELLAKLIHTLHRLHIGTLDGFTVGLIRAFPLEMGISPNITLMDNGGAEAVEARNRVLDTIFRSRDPRLRKRFIQSFNGATHGQNPKSLERILSEYIANYHSQYQAVPNENKWGQEAQIWPNGLPWKSAGKNLLKTIDQFGAFVAGSGWKDPAKNRWNLFLDEVSLFHAGSEWSTTINYVFKNLVPAYADICRGEVTLKIDRSACSLGPVECKLLGRIFSHIMHAEITCGLKKTQGLYQVLQQFEEEYDIQIRRSGILTFDDINYLLSDSDTSDDGLVLSQYPGTDHRLYIDYRLDCRLHHWLLDEFQDTSNLQWGVLENLIDEVVQNSEGNRSFFYVGDVKQAIYAWRGGNPRLFQDILNRYGDAIHQRPLDVSYRSAPPVIEMVNRVFTGLPNEISKTTRHDWKNIWREHQCSDRVKDLTGYAVVLEPFYDGKNKPGNEDRYELVAQLLQEIKPLEQGLSTAILVRTNKEGGVLVHYLRDRCPSMDIIHEGVAEIRDNPVVGALLALIKFAAHPGDNFAWRQLQMGPFGEYFIRNKLNREQLPLQLLQDIQAKRFQSFIRHWGECLRDICPLDPFGEKRLKDLIESAAEFDACHQISCDAFLSHVENAQIKDPSGENAVRVMTVHQSKGLGFDIVILPGLQSGSITGGGQPEFVAANQEGKRQPKWLLDMPRRLVCEADETLREELHALDASSSFQDLCVLYVAMTRAKRGLYVVTSFPGKGSTSFTGAALIKQQLCGDIKALDGREMLLSSLKTTVLYEAGDPDWHKKLSGIDKKAPAPDLQQIPDDFAQKTPPRKKLIRISPSQKSGGDGRGAFLFNPDMEQAGRLGTAVHELFEQVEWSDEADAKDIAAIWREQSTFPEDITDAAVKQFLSAMKSPEVKQALVRPTEPAEVWREKRFEVIIDNQWITGVFDRVTLARNKAGEIVHATVLDYKSNRISDEADLMETAGKYEHQLKLYKGALEKILHLPPSSITTCLLFTHPGRLVTIEVK